MGGKKKPLIDSTRAHLHPGAYAENLAKKRVEAVEGVVIRRPFKPLGDLERWSRFRALAEGI